MKSGIVIFCLLLPFVSPAISPKQLKCLVCRSVVEEIEGEIASANPSHTIDVGSYRLDDKGNQKQKKIQYARSEMHLSEVLDSICTRFEDYVQATYKSNGQPLIMRLMTKAGTMNPLFGEVDIVPDADLNKSLKYYCETIVEEHDEDILRLFTAESSNVDIRLCSDHAKVCEQTLSDDYNHEDGHEEL